MGCSTDDLSCKFVGWLMAGGTGREDNMIELPEAHLSTLREKIEQQRNTIEALKRDAHECADAERQLKQMLEEMQVHENLQRQA